MVDGHKMRKRIDSISLGISDVQLTAPSAYTLWGLGRRNLVLGLLSHLLHPHRSIPPLKLPKPLLGAALISPWGDFSTTALSYQRKEFKDSIDASVLRKRSAYFMRDADTDYYNQPFCAPASWWKDLNGTVQDVLITAGTEKLKVCTSAVEPYDCKENINQQVRNSSPL